MNERSERLKNFWELSEKYKAIEDFVDLHGKEYEKPKKNLKGLSNWTLGISVGIFSLILNQIRDYNPSDYIVINLFYLIAVLMSVSSVLYSGIIKLRILTTEINSNANKASFKTIIKSYNNSSMSYSKLNEYKVEFEMKNRKYGKEFLKTIKHFNLSVFVLFFCITFLTIYIISHIITTF